MTDERVGGLMFIAAGVSFFVPFLGLMLSTMISKGGREEAVGVIDYVKIKTTKGRPYCDIFILVKNQEIVEIFSERNFCERYFAKGSEIAFSYKKNLY